MPVRPIGSREELALIVNRIGRRLQLKANRTARSKARIARLNLALASERARVIRANWAADLLNDRDGAKVWVYVEANPELRRGSVAELGSGTASYRSLKEGALVFDLDEQTTIEELRQRFPEVFDDIVETKETIRKNVLKRQFPDVLDQLSTASAPSLETFTIHPSGTEEILRRTVDRIRSFAIKAGFIANPGATQSPAA